MKIKELLKINSIHLDTVSEDKHDLEALEFTITQTDSDNKVYEHYLIITEECSIEFKVRKLNIYLFTFFLNKEFYVVADNMKGAMDSLYEILTPEVFEVFQARKLSEEEYHKLITSYEASETFAEQGVYFDVAEQTNNGLRVLRYDCSSRL